MDEATQDLQRDAQAVVDNPSVGNAVELEQDFQPLVPAVVKETKAGYKTTEFWLSLGASLLIAFGTLPTPHDAKGFAVAAIVALYAVARGLAKKGIPSVEEE